MLGALWHFTSRSMPGIYRRQNLYRLVYRGTIGLQANIHTGFRMMKRNIAGLRGWRGCVAQAPRLHSLTEQAGRLRYENQTSRTTMGRDNERLNACVMASFSQQTDADGGLPPLARHAGAGTAAVNRSYDPSTGNPALFHSGKPFSRRRAWRPFLRNCATASNASRQYGPRQ